MKTREPSERAGLRPRGAATRCPFCHEGCPSEAEVAVCRSCLSRHHADCWSEAGQACASCGAAEALAPQAEAARTSNSWALGAGPLWALWAAQGGVGLALVSSLDDVWSTYCEFGALPDPPILRLLFGQGFLLLFAILALVPLARLVERLTKRSFTLGALILSWSILAALLAFLVNLRFPGGPP